MTFFQDQARARRRTWVLVALYTLAIILIVVFIYIGLVFLFISAETADTHEALQAGLWHPQIFTGTVVSVLGLIVAGTIFRMIQLARGGVAVAEALHGRLLDHETATPEEKRILNIVEEIAIASGIRIPPVYVLDEEASINAFAAGYKPNTAVIGISKGSLAYLNRDELQGVVAHEFSHILNGDMRLNIRLMSILHGILMLTIAGRLCIRMGLGSGRHRRSNEKNSQGGLVAIGAVFLIVGLIGLISAKIIKMAVSRQREFLADASAVQFTRNPNGIAGALLKIGGLSQHSYLTAAQAEDVSHLCFANALSGFFSRLQLFSTHPPLADRIKKINPSFDGNFPVVQPLVESTQAETDSTSTSTRQPKKNALDILIPGQIMNMVGTIPAGAMQASRTLLDSVPASLSEASHTPLDAAAIVCCLLIAPDAALRTKQRDAIKLQLPEVIYTTHEKKQADIDSLSEEQRLPVLDMAIGSLKRLSKSQYLQLRHAAHTLIHADDSVSLFEYTVYHILTRSLDTHFSLPVKRSTEIKDLTKLLLPTSKLLFALAHYGHENREEAMAAYTTACDSLGITESARLSANLQSTLSASFLDAALLPLDTISPHVQGKIFEACIACITHDGKVTPAEKQLVRVIGEVLDCPVPLL